MRSNSNRTSTETDATEYFRRTFTEKFDSFRHEADMLMNGNTEYNATFKDKLARNGLALSFVVIAGVIGILGAVSVLSAVVSAGVAIPVGIAGVAATILINELLEMHKQKNYERAAILMDGVDIITDIQAMADTLAELYKMQLSHCTLKDAHILAEGCVKAITQDMFKNKNFNFDDLLYAPSLQGVLMRSISKVPKKPINMTILTHKKLNARGLIAHTAYYCKETDEYYKSAKSKSAKYGVLLFDKKADLEDYEAILTTSMRHGKKWKFSKMRQHEVNVLKRSSLFKSFNSDVSHDKKESMLDVRSSRVKVT
tara:strand:- start:166 stop:1101 length:936 start_codon:yes stop_codon:yes gene_type:complete